MFLCVNLRLANQNGTIDDANGKKNNCRMEIDNKKTGENGKKYLSNAHART